MCILCFCLLVLNWLSLMADYIAYYVYRKTLAIHGYILQLIKKFQRQANSEHIKFICH